MLKNLNKDLMFFSKADSYIVINVNNFKKDYQDFYKKNEKNFLELSTLKLERNGNVYLTVHFDILSYVETKKNFFFALKNEDLQYFIIYVKYGHNFFDVDFFENEVLENICKYEFLEDFAFITYFTLILINMNKKKIIFTILSCMYKNFTFFKKNLFI